MTSHRTCAFPDCNRPHFSRGWCRLHHKRWWKHGSPDVSRNVQAPLEERFWRFVTPADGCWNWRGGTGRGYAYIGTSSKRWSAHRLVFQMFGGVLDAALTIDHLCMNTLCVRPDHLEQVGGRTNTLRGFGVTATNARKTHCPAGHPYTGRNLYTPPSGGRYCRECIRLRKREKVAKKADEGVYVEIERGNVYSVKCRRHAFVDGRCILCERRCLKAAHYPQLDLPAEYDIRLHSGEDCA